MNILLTIAYDGTHYSGWQRQENANTIQAEVERALSKAYSRPVAVTGASRTDAGVHALGQRAAFTVLPDDHRIPPEKVPYMLNTLLPADIRILAGESIPESFHPIFDATDKTYAYRIWNGPFDHPLARLYAEHVYLPLELHKMERAAAYFEGRHDFKAFCAAGGSAKTSVRTIHSLRLRQEGSLITMEVNGNGFLYNMVRIIAGTLIDVGTGKISVEDIPGIIASLDRTRAGKTAEARGLTLMEIHYASLEGLNRALNAVEKNML